ncbi:membrane or secreted protein [Gilvibacter sp.]|uniref:membrane or secreted protein n=1 Tax=Gilvibacter sp. TaxID=2729997 RepID=UPI003F4A5B0F
MRNILLAVGFMLSSLSLQGQELIGAWEYYGTTPQGQEVRQVVIFADGFQVLTIYDAKSGTFIHTNGGLWSKKGNTLTETVEFNSDNPEAVGNSISFDIRLTDKELQIVGDDRVFTRVDDGSPGALNGAWLMSGRKRNGEMQERDTSRPRKTMKILSGTRFQWIAYNTETKQFMATGGGSYTTVDGKYTENIEFFSRDVSRVGAALEFDFKLVDGHWHHSGFSSKGDPLYEVWSERSPQ